MTANISHLLLSDSHYAQPTTNIKASIGMPELEYRLDGLDDKMTDVYCCAASIVYGKPGAFRYLFIAKDRVSKDTLVVKINRGKTYECCPLSFPLLESVLPDEKGNLDNQKINSICILYEDDRVFLCVTNCYKMLFGKANSNLLYVDPMPGFSFSYPCFGYKRSLTNKIAIYFEQCVLTDKRLKSTLMRCVTDGIIEAKAEKVIEFKTSFCMDKRERFVYIFDNTNEAVEGPTITKYSIRSRGNPQKLSSIRTKADGGTFYYAVDMFCTERLFVVCENDEQCYEYYNSGTQLTDEGIVTFYDIDLRPMSTISDLRYLSYSSHYEFRPNVVAAVYEIVKRKCSIVITVNNCYIGHIFAVNFSRRRVSMITSMTTGSHPISNSVVVGKSLYIQLDANEKHEIDDLKIMKLTVKIN